MAITFPRSLAISNARMSECWFDLIDNVAFTPSGKNATLINLSQVNDPTWKGHFVTPILERTERPIWSAWHKSLRGGLKTFIAYDVRNSTPFAYPNAKASTDIFGSWNGTAGVSSVGTSGALGLSLLPAGYQFKVGDRVGLEQAGKYGYYEVFEDVTASGGGTATITVGPFLHSMLFTAGVAVCRVWRPVCQFQIDQSSWIENGTVENKAISFEGLQRL